MKKVSTSLSHSLLCIREIDCYTPVSYTHLVFLETAHPAKFLETVESIIGEAVEIPAKLQEFMKGEKKSLQMTKDFADFKKYLLTL